MKKEIAEEKKVWKLLKIDSSLIFLIFSNVITIFFALKENWSLLTLMWIYWSQSIIIGIFNFIRILKLKNFTTKNFRMNNKKIEATDNTKYSVAFFFLFHYGFFHFIYMIFLLTGSFIKFPGFSKTSVFFVLISIIIFFSNHLFSFIHNYENDSKKKRNIGTVMFFPYARIVPMHLTLIFGLFLTQSKFALILFIILKTIADIIMHQVEHNI